VYASHCDNSQNTLFPSFLQHHNYADGRLAVLIELNEYVTLVLNKLDLIATDLHEDSPHSPHLLPLAAEHPARNPDNNTQRTALGGRLHNHLNLAVNTGNSGVGSAMARKVGESAFSAVPPQVLILLLFHMDFYFSKKYVKMLVQMQGLIHIFWIYYLILILFSSVSVSL